jgi:hypothetical protein
MISTRFLPALCALTALALIPTFLHSYSDGTVRDARTTAAIPEQLAGYAGTPSGRNATWGQRRFDSHDWIERTYRSSTDEVKLSVIRSYDAKALYHHPELAVAYGPSYTGTDIRRVARRPDVPLFVLRSNSGVTAVYALLYEDQFVENPIRFQLATAGELLFSGRKAMTLFFLTDERGSADGDLEQLPSLDLLFAAIDRFVSSR